MRVSIITTCFNSEATIGDTLDSVARQTHPDIEHIVVDGGSTDSTADIVRNRGKHVARMISGPDKGIYDAMNKGIACATGELVGFLNSDDVLSGPGCINLISAAAEDPGIAAVYGDLVYVHAEDLGKVVRAWRSGTYFPSKLRFGWMPPHPTFYVRRSLLSQYGGFDTGLRIAADYDFMLRLLTGHNISVAYIPEVLVRMRIGGASNRSFKALFNKSREDLVALRKNHVGGFGTLLCKNLQKIPQFFV
jgi:glycosyltransferase